jgi:hypothetical protein
MLGDFRQHVADEAYRVLAPGGTIRMFESTAGGALLETPFINAGFATVALAGWIVSGVKP